MQFVSWSLQILILTAGIHLFLRFVRTTRGNPLIRGLFLSVLVGVVGLWMLASVLKLEELEEILESSTGLIVVGLVIIFHPELRRGIAQLGERRFAGASRSQSADALRNVVQAARAMAARRDGALIAFERESSLRTVVETGSAIGARINARLLESVFHPGGALHDGAVVIRGDQVVAAGCILPLSKGDKLDRSKGTRHRAALGLTEESDAIVVVVSEETGSISLARDGEITSDIAPDRLETELRSLVEGSKGSLVSGPGVFAMLATAIRKDGAWLAGSLLLGTGAWYAAHQSIREDRSFNIQIVDGKDVGRRTPRDGEIIVLTPTENMRVRTTSDDSSFKLEVSGSRGQFDDLAGRLRGTLEIDDPKFDGGPLDLDLVRWEVPIVGLGYEWKSGTNGPELVVDKTKDKRIPLDASHILPDVSYVDPRFKVRTDEITFEPRPEIRVIGPENLIDDLGGEIPLELEPIKLSRTDVGEVRARIRLKDRLLERNFKLAGDPGDAPIVVIPVLPVEREIASIRKDIALVCLDPEKRNLLDEWVLPANAQVARFKIVTSGLIPVNADLGTPALVEHKTKITRFVEENLRVYVDVADLPPPDEGRSVAIRSVLAKDWRESPEEIGLDVTPGSDPDVGLDESTLKKWAKLEVRLESDAIILLEPRPNQQSEERL